LVGARRVPREHKWLQFFRSRPGYKDPFIPNPLRVRRSFYFNLDQPPNKFVSDIHYTHNINTQACNHSLSIPYGRFFLFMLLLILLLEREMV